MMTPGKMTEISSSRSITRSREEPFRSEPPRVETGPFFRSILYDPPRAAITGTSLRKPLQARPQATRPDSAATPKRAPAILDSFTPF